MSKTNPWERAIKRVLGKDAGYVGLVETAADKTYPIDIYVPTNKIITGVAFKTLSGTITAKLQKNGVDITGLTAIAVTNVRAVTNPTAPYNGTNSLVAGDVLTIITSGNAAALDLAFDIFAELN